MRPIRVLDPDSRGRHTGRLIQLARRKAHRFDFASHTLLMAYVRFGPVKRDPLPSDRRSKHMLNQQRGFALGSLDTVDRV